MTFEGMLISAAREIKDGEIIFAGFQWPLLAAIFAKMTHAKNAILAFEGGIIKDDLPERFPSSTTDSVLFPALLSGGTVDTMGMLQAGHIDIGMLNASTVDRFGNINTSFVGGRKTPKVRLAGGGGAPDIACLAKRHVILLDGHEGRRLPEKVDFITSPGYITGRDAREKIGLRGGPSALITPLCVFRFDKNGEAYLDTLHGGASVKEVRERTGWKLKVAKNIKMAKKPSERELRILRNLIDEAGGFYNIPE
jgi:glutaconate CoA-transferase subunit B